MTVSLEQFIHKVRVDVVKMFYKAKRGHFSSALSCVDILSTIFADKTLSTTRGKVVLSKAHGAGALYTILMHLGSLPKEYLGTLYACETNLISLASPISSDIPIPAGSLGQGICFATGVAKAYQLKQMQIFAYCVLGDGESQEGSVWEAAMFAGNHQLNKLIVIMDCNDIQGTDRISNICSIEPLEDKWKSFNWNTLHADGHDCLDLKNKILLAQTCQNKPTIIFAKTIKGYGVPPIANNDTCHMKQPNLSEWNSVCANLGITLEELETL